MRECVLGKGVCMACKGWVMRVLVQTVPQGRFANGGYGCAPGRCPGADALLYVSIQ